MSAPTAYSWKTLRISRGWKQAKVLHLIESVAADVDVTLPTRSSLKTMLSRWENGAHMSALYTDIFCRIYELPTPHGDHGYPSRDPRLNSRVFTRVFGHGPTTTPADSHSVHLVGAR